MNTEFVIQDNQVGTVYDAADLPETFTWSGQIREQPGKLSFSVVRDGTLKFYEGSRVRLILDKKKLFFGTVFEKNRTNFENTAVIAYDQMRYLKNEDTEVFPVGTASQRFEYLCKKWKFQYKVVHPSTHLLPEEPFDKKSVMDMIQRGIDRTLIDSGKWYMVRDNFGTLEFVDIAYLKTNLVLAPDSLMTGFSYKTSIDKETYNQIKLYRDNKESGKRDVYIVKDSETIDRWGLLQFTESMDEEMNDAQIRERANRLLLLRNRVSRTLSLTCVGDWRVMPGAGVWVETSLDDMKLSRYMICHSVEHTVKNRDHMMKVGLEVAEE